MSKQDRLSNDEFLAKLTTLLQSTHTSTHGSIFLTQKSLPPSDTTDTAQILIRATNGATVASKKSKLVPKDKITKSHAKKEKVKLATAIDAKDVEIFYGKYAEVCKKGMEGLRKRDRRKAKGKAKGKKTKGKVGAGA